MASGDSPRLSQLRTVLLGSRGSGKSSSGNTLLGSEAFDPRTGAESVARQGEVAGRQLTVVNTPGWNFDHPIERTIELVKQEIVLSVSLCPPGPHALLLLIRLDDSFEEAELMSVEQHMQLLTERVWGHTMVLFTYSGGLGGTSVEQRVERSECLRWLVEKCGSRYHVLNIGNRSDVTQVTELLDKMERMASGNGSHYEMDREILERTEERKRAVEEKAQERATRAQKRRAALRSQMGDAPYLSELRVVLLGYRCVGKSSSMNTILDSEFELRRIAHCVKRQGEAAGRQLTVIDTPCWFVNICVEITTEKVKQEIVRSVSLCPPGPHTLLLVIRLDRSFTEHHMKSIEGHLQLLGDRVWRHTMLLFTFGDWLGDTSIEQHIEREGYNLQCLVEKCDNRYHILNNEDRSDVTQVTELLDKMEEMVAGNRGDHYEINREILRRLEERRRGEEERARQRLAKVQKQRETLRAQVDKSAHLSELRIVLLGWRFVGKSTSGNTILGTEVFTLNRTTQCVKNQGDVAGAKVTVVDTPGWLVNLPAEITSDLVKQEIAHSVSLCLPGPHTFLLVIRLDETFTDEHKRSVVGHLQRLSDRVWSHTMVLFICGICLGGTTIEQHIESEGEALQWLVEKCGNRYHVFDNWDSGAAQVTELLDKIKETVAGNRGGHYEIDKEIRTLENRRRSTVKKAKQKEEHVTKERQKLRTSMGESLRLSKLSVVLLGWRRAGKTSSGNTILGREEFDLMTAAAAQCVTRQGEVAGRDVTVVDTPGWWANLPAEETPEMVQQEIVRSVSLCPPGPHTLLLVVPLVISFTEDIANAVEEHLELLGEEVWSRTVVVFTGGDNLGETSIEQHIVREGKVLQWLIVKCGNRYHVLDNQTRGDDTQVVELLEKIEEMVAGSRDAAPVFDEGGGETSPQSSTPAPDLEPISEEEPQKPALNPGPKHGARFTPQGPPPSILKPMLSTRPTEPSYRLQCPHAGLFQCSLTGLGFQMAGAGEVLYSLVQWDEGLLASTGQTPAGPLFSIDCPQRSVSQLHLPHCEVLSGEGLESLSVAHVSGYKVLLLPPLRVTETHMGAENAGLSLWGLVRESPLITIRGQVLPFLKSLGPQRSVLNLIVLPANIPLKEVERTQKGSSYIPVYSDCTLSRGEALIVCCDVVERNRIKEGVQDWSYSPSYPPTFQVFLRADTDEVKLKLQKRGGQGEEVWAARIPLTGAFLMCDRPAEPAQSGSAEDQLRSSRKEFVKRVSKTVLSDMLDGLLDKRVINENEMMSVKEEQHKTERARDVIDMVMSKGTRACSVMITTIYDLDNCLYHTLGFN